VAFSSVHSRLAFAGLTLYAPFCRMWLRRSFAPPPTRPPRSRLCRREIPHAADNRRPYSLLSPTLWPGGVVHSLPTRPWRWPWRWPRVLSRSRLPRSPMCASGLSACLDFAFRALGLGGLCVCVWSCSLASAGRCRGLRAHTCMHRARVLVPFCIFQHSALQKETAVSTAPYAPTGLATYAVYHPSHRGRL
jgi:hypothetical protein